MNSTNKTVVHLVVVFFVFFAQVHSKYVEGQLKTLQDWAFLSRFCFISGKGRFEYTIEFERRYGEPQLLLYYDDITQWPAVYKTKTTCQQKLAVLSSGDNQIVTLSARPPYNFLSGCSIQTKNSNAKPPLGIPTPTPELDSTYFDQFLRTSTEETVELNVTIPDYDFENSTALNETADIKNDVDVFNITNYLDNGIPISRDTVVLSNVLENGTEFLNDVEELFTLAPVKGENPTMVRMRRSLPSPLNFKREGRGTYIVTCSNIGGFTSSRERWWYIAIANCGSGHGLNISYRFRLTNGPPGDFWHEHFSADEMYILPILLTESICYSILVLVVFRCAIRLKALHLFHCTYRMFGFSVILQWVGAFLQAFAYAMYALTGLSARTMLGGLFMGASEVTFLGLMLLMAKGYTITRARISSSSSIKLAMFLNVYIVAYISLYIFQAEYFDPGEVMNLYESPAGFGLAGLRIGSWAAFIISAVTTLKKNPEKASFYFPFVALGSLWIVGGPITTVFGIFVLDPWVRESVICFVRATISFSGHVCFLYLTWPSRANKSFPYHVRTNHVGIASDEDDGADYPRHTYEPSLADQNTIIPLSRRTEELLNGVYGQYLNNHLGYGVNASTATYPRNPSAPSPVGTPNVIRNDMNRHHDLHLRNAPASPKDNDETDSGHPSLETTSVASPNDATPSPSNEDSPNRRTFGPHSTVEPPMLDRFMNPNPFIVNGIQRAPNKIILDPIDHPVIGNDISATAQAVPRHLFAAKNPNK